MPGTIVWVPTNRVAGFPPNVDRFKETLRRLQLDFITNLQYTRDNYAVYYCADHQACQKRIKMVNEGEFVQVFEAGQNGVLL